MSLLLLACVTGAPAPAELPPERLLARVSLDLRGQRPSPAELDAVLEDPALVDRYVDAWLDGPDLPERIVSLYARAWRLRADSIDFEVAGLALDDPEPFLTSVGEEALRVLAQVVATDRPYTDLYTSDWTMVDPVLAEWYPVDYPAGAEGWVELRWVDGRPPLGILATNGLWWRYSTTLANANRGRANAISRMFLCNDYLLLPIVQPDDLDLTDEEAVAEAIDHNPACVGCHVSLDPIGSYLWGFASTAIESPLDVATYVPEHELWWEHTTGIAPAWFGEPAQQAADLGPQLAGDPRVVECAVETATELLLQRETTLDDAARLVAHRQAFLDAELRLKALYRAILASPEYRAAPGADPAAGRWKVVDADLLVQQVEGITGMRFAVDGVDVYRVDRWGLRSLASGGAGASPGAAPELSPTSILVQARLAEAAAWAAAARDAADPAAAHTFTLVDFTETTADDRAAMQAQVEELWRRALSARPAAEDVALLLDLWAEVHDARQDPVEAWAAVLSVILRHPDFLVY